MIDTRLTSSERLSQKNSTRTSMAHAKRRQNLPRRLPFNDESSSDSSHSPFPKATQQTVTTVKAGELEVFVVHKAFLSCARRLSTVLETRKLLS